MAATNISPEPLVCTPDYGVELPFDSFESFLPLHERAAAACETLAVLMESGVVKKKDLKVNKEDKDTIKEIVEAFAEDEAKISKQVATATKYAAMTPGALIGVHELLKEFSHSVVKSASQIRHLVTNKLLLETNNANPQVRIKALELLGKMSDVALFTERSEVTVHHKSTEELKLTLKEKLQMLKAPRNEEIMDVEVREMDKEGVKGLKSFDLDGELGLITEENEKSPVETAENEEKEVKSGVGSE